MKGLLTCFHAIAPSVKSEKLDVSCFDDARMHAAHDEAKIASREDFENAFSLNNQKYETDDHFQWEGMLTMRASANKLIGALVTTSGNVSYGILADAAHKIYYLVDAQNGFQKKDNMSDLFVPGGEKFTAYFLVQAPSGPEPAEKVTPAKQAKEEPQTPMASPIEPQPVTTPVAPAAQVPTPAAPKKAGPGGRAAKKRTEAPTEKPDAVPEPEAKKEKV